MEILDFEIELEKIYNQIKENKLAVLATSSENKPTARTMSIIFLDNKIYCQTSIEYIKCKQLMENKNVAVCIFNLQIEGIANIKGRTTDFDEFIKMYKIIHEDSFKKYSKLECSRLIEIIPKKIIKWDYDSNGKPSRIFIDLVKKEIYRKLEEYTE
jgi:uncharacterized pyridoxamine 5'-phosphate oxidase family protein